MSVCLLQNKLNINDWSSVQSLFDKLNKQMEKAQKATETLGAPRVYIKMLVELEVSLPATGGVKTCPAISRLSIRMWQCSFHL
jgi:translation initiation factor 3 subunit C